MRQRIIALVDCDCFFVSCERVDNPDLNGKPVCVTTGAGSKGIVVSRSNEAKALGIKMGQPLFQIEGQFQNCHYLPARHKRYAQISKQVMDILRTFSPDVEEVSVDEAYIDLTGFSKLYKLSYKDIIIKIRNTILDKAKIPVSIGLSTSKTLAKFASDKAKKTGGIFIIHPQNASHILKESDLEEICGISHKTALNFAKRGIFTLEAFLEKTPAWCRQAFGINGERLRYELDGICTSPVNALEEAPQSIQDTKALEDFTTSLTVLKSTLPQHIHRASQKLRKWNGYCSVLSVMLRTKDFKVMETEIKLDRQTNSEQTLLSKAEILLEQMYTPKTLYRSLGVTLKNLAFGNTEQHSLFEKQEREDDKVSHLLDELEEKYGKQVIKLGL